MSKIRESIERRYPRYRLGHPTAQLAVWAGGSRVLTEHITVTDCEQLIKDRNELVDKLIEASELLAEAVDACMRGEL